MTSEKQLREIAAGDIRDHRRFIAEGLAQLHPELGNGEPERLAELITRWPILDLPVGDRDGTWWPLHGYTYGHVQRRGDRIIISRGDKPMHLTKGEALELASLLTAAATEEA